MKRPQKLLRKEDTTGKKKAFEVSSKEHKHKYDRGVPVITRADKELFITSYRMPVSGSIDPALYYTFTPSTWRAISTHIQHNDDKAINKIVEMRKTYHVASENIWLHLLVIVNHYVLKIPSLFEDSIDESVRISRAFDVLLLLDGFEDLEYRFTNNSETSNYLINTSRVYAPAASKERYFRNMRIFIEHNKVWRSYYDKQILQLYFDKGLKLREIVELHRDGKTGDLKKVSKVAIGAKINTYRKQMLKMMENRPELFDEEGLSGGYIGYVTYTKKEKLGG